MSARGPTASPVEAGGNTTIENARLRLVFSNSTGMLVAVVNKESGLALGVSQSFCYYYGALKTLSGKDGSGAYLMRTAGSTCHAVARRATIAAVVRGDVVQEVRQVFSPWLTQTVRLGASWRHAEFEHTIGPVPVWLGDASDDVAAGDAAAACPGCALADRDSHDADRDADHATSRPAVRAGAHAGGHAAAAHRGLHSGTQARSLLPAGREVVSRFVTTVASGGAMLTDSNGREMLRRRRDVRPTWNFSQTEPVAGK